MGRPRDYRTKCTDRDIQISYRYPYIWNLQISYEHSLHMNLKNYTN